MIGIHAMIEIPVMIGGRGMITIHAEMGADPVIMRKRIGE
jgi:hypothetical protein